MQTRLTIKARLNLTLTLLGAIAVVLSGLGIWGMRSSNAAAQQTYEKYLAAAIDMGNTEAYIGRQRTSLDRAAIAPGSADASDMFAMETQVLQTSKDWWNRFLALPRDAEEDRLSEAVTKQIASEETHIDDYRDAIRSGDHDTIVRVAIAVGHNYTALQNATAALKDYQFNAARQNYLGAQSQNSLFTWICSLGALAAVLAAGFNAWSIKRAIGVPLDSALHHFNRIAVGDLSQPIEIHSRDEMGQLLEGMRTMRDGLIKTVSSVRHGSTSIAAATHQIAAGNMDLSSRTEEQAAALQETASSMGELSSTVSHNADNAKHASTLALSANHIAGRGRVMVSTMVSTMGEINSSSNKIGDIIALIEGIAFQTNILALNAAVEAARAGEQGRGFAVVASEVRSLAQRSSSAAGEIKLLITASVDRVKRGSQEATDAGVTMTEMTSAVQRVADIIAEISAASDEQRRGIEQVTHAISQMDQVTQQNAALVEEASATAQALDEQARLLNSSVAVFTL